MIDNDTLQFLTHLHRGGTYGFWWLSARKQSIWWKVDHPTNLHINAGDNVYFGVHPTKAIPTTNACGEPSLPCWVRSQKPYIAAVNCLFAEFDQKDFNNDIAAVARHIESLPVPPSVQILSGGGIHTYHLLRDPFIIASVDHLEAIAYAQRAWSKMVKADASKDLPRVLRVPGTFNYKYSPPRLVMWYERDLDRTYTLADLIIHLPPPPATTPPRRSPPTTKQGSPRPIEVFNDTPIADLLERYGYRPAGQRRMLSPYSTTGQPGVSIDDNTNRAYVHHESDPLHDGYWKRPFDVVSILDFGGNWRAALDSIRGTP